MSEFEECGDTFDFPVLDFFKLYGFHILNRK